MAVFLCILAAPFFYWFFFIKPIRDNITEKRETKIKFENVISALKRSDFKKEFISKDSVSFSRKIQSYIQVGTSTTYKTLGKVSYYYSVSRFNGKATVNSDSHHFSVSASFPGVKTSSLYKSKEIPKLKNGSPIYLSTHDCSNIFNELWGEIYDSKEYKRAYSEAENRQKARYL
ncbi:MAG: hypothetical protein H6559_20820 [Lewinellaceae bacterium]|nr:hypothetical protein [Lewinellaceae bacterium]